MSLDFEMHWGVRDNFTAVSSFRENFLGERRAIPQILDLFDEYGVSATWATVGMLFAASRDELETYVPAERPAYRDPRLSPYRGKLTDLNDLERLLRDRLDALGPAPRAVLLNVLKLPDHERARRISELYGDQAPRRSRCS